MSKRLITCPYNPCHQILPERFSAHLTKCKKNHPGKEMQICPFNATHHVEAHLFKAHITECPNKRIVERDLFKAHQLVREDQDSRQEQFIPKDTDYTTEDWDTEAVNGAYDPGSSVLDREIVRQPPLGLTKSNRTKWRKAEEMRVQRIREGRQIEDIVFPTKTGTITIEQMREEGSFRQFASGHREDDEDEEFGRALMDTVQKTRRPMIMAAGLSHGLTRDCNSGPSLNVPSTKNPCGPGFGRGLLPLVQRTEAPPSIRPNDF